MATDSYRRMSDRVFTMNWQELSVDLQKNVIVMIANMQRPLFYHGSGIVEMDLNTFINVSDILALNDPPIDRRILWYFSSWSEK